MSARKSKKRGCVSDPMIELLRAHNLAADVATKVQARGLDRTQVAHGLFCEAIMQLLDCDLDRADGMARGFVVLAVADQKRYIETKASDIIDRAIKGDLKSDPSFALQVRRGFGDGAALLMGGVSIPRLPGAAGG